MPRPTHPSIAYSIVDGVLLVAHGKDHPDDETWDRMVVAALELARNQPLGRSLVTSEGGAPTAAQRHRFDLRVREVMEKSRGLQGRVAIMSHSAFVRAVVQASTLFESSWFARKTRGESSRVYRAFLPSEVRQALAWLDIPAAKTALLEQELEKLRREVA